MQRIVTNRDLYRFVARLIEEHYESERTLARYLTSLRTLFWRHRGLPVLGPDLFGNLIADAFVVDPPVLERLATGTRAVGFDAVDAALARQLADLHEMAEAGILDDEMRNFGIEGPSGSHWCNFEPQTWVECATEGAFGGWHEGDDTSRILVPDQVALIGPDGFASLVDPHEIEEVPVALKPITWADVLRFVECGQSYE